MCQIVEEYLLKMQLSEKNMFIFIDKESFQPILEDKILLYI